MIPWLLLSLPWAAVAALDNGHGVSPALLSKYTPTNGKWKCLDGSKEIPWSSVNDDYCDCKDGSDEPGTSACPNSSFYCHNAGHIGASIPASRVNDGLCEKACCDGSDEPSGVCPNICKQVGEVYRLARNAERKIQKTGAKIRGTYIAFAQKEKKRLEALVVSLEKEILDREAEVRRLKEIADRTESISQAALEHKQKSPLYTSLMDHSTALKSLHHIHQKQLERERALGEILDALRTGYNPNYQDMAVLEAVRGWEQLAGLRHINDADEEGSDEDDEPEKGEVLQDEETPEGLWNKEETEKQLEALKKVDHVGLLMAHDEHLQTPVSGSILFDLGSYIPDDWVPGYESFKSSILNGLHALGIVSAAVSSSADSSAARAAFNAAESALKSSQDARNNAAGDLGDLFAVNGFGKDGEWKKLDNTCLELDTGEYTYELCLFNEAKQKPNKGGTTFSLGKFHSWNLSADEGTPAYYSKQFYTGGTRCWNGPERSVQLVWVCGVENKITAVAELEKCEYQLTGTTPALCLPLDEDIKDEL